MLQESLLKLIEKEVSFFNSVSPLTESNILLALERNGLVLKYIENQTDEMIETALKQNAMALQYVRNKTDRICLTAVKHCGRALQFVEKQTPIICETAIKKYAPSFLYVKEQTDELSLLAVTRDSRLFRLVKKQTLEICLAAIRKNGLLLEYVEPQFKTEEVVRLAVKQNVNAIQFVECISPWMIFEAVKAGNTMHLEEVVLDERCLNELIKTSPMKVTEISCLTSEIIWTLQCHGTNVHRWIGTKPCDSLATSEFLLRLWLIEGKRDIENYYLKRWKPSWSEEDERRFNYFLNRVDRLSHDVPTLDERKKWYYEMLLMSDEQCLEVIKSSPIKVLALEKSRLTEAFCFSLVELNDLIYIYLPLECRTTRLSRYVVRRNPQFRIVSPYFNDEEYYFEYLK